MAARWLDAARYADTNGYQTDAERYMWRWRDWVIEAYNRNLSFDQFAVQQIAGDMLPRATLDQKIATGFNRNHRGNGEGGIIPEEYAVEYVVDRVETTSTVFMGLTLGCARCHDHKYDPFTQKEFYQLFAYFNNIPERGKANKYGNSAPMIQAPTVAQQAQLKEIDQKLAAAEKRFAGLRAEAARAQRSWEASLAKSTAIHWSIPHDLVGHFPLDGELPATAQVQDGEPQFVQGRIGQAAAFDGKRFILGGNVGAFGFYDKFTLAAWIYPTTGTGAIITRTKDIEEESGYGLYLKDGKVQANLILRWLDDGARVETVKPIELNRWQHVMMTYDGSRMADGIKIYVDGRSQELTVHLDDVNQNFPDARPPAGRRRRWSGKPVPRADRRCAGVRRGAVADGGGGRCDWRIDQRDRRDRRGEEERAADRKDQALLSRESRARAGSAELEAARRHPKREAAIPRQSADRDGDAGTRHGSRHVPVASRRVRQTRRQRSRREFPRSCPPCQKGSRTTGSALRAGWSIRPIL